MQYPHLFEPIKLGDVLLQNRIVANPMSWKFEDRCLGGPGVVICGSTIVEPERSSWAGPDEPYAFEKYHVEEARRRILKAHQTGAAASIELGHAGQYARVKDFAMGPSSLVREDGTEVRAMTPEMMEHTAACWARAARDARDIGFDMVFLHFGHGWLVDEFLSPLFNRRTDEYGGSIENRMRFPLQILAACREAVGPAFPMEVRVSASEWMPGGIELEDVIAFCREAQRYVTSIQVSSGLDIEHEANVHMAATNFDPHMLNAPYARAIRAAVDVPVTLVGSIETPEEAEELIANGTCDMVALARALAADPFWPEKAREGRAEDIVPCLRCLQCYHIATNRRNVGCSVNPRYANEDFVPLELEPAKTVKNVLVVGAGPAGCKAALTAAGRGHRVTLAERDEEIGGALRLIAREAHKEDVARYLGYLRTQVEKSPIDLRLSCEADADFIRDMGPDAVVIAVGASPFTPPIPGSDREGVVGFADAILDPSALGRRVVVVGGGTIGAELGLELAESGKHEVTIVEMGDKIAAQGNMLYRIALRQMFEKQQGRLVALTGATCTGISSSVVSVAIADEGERDIPYDSVVIASGVRANRACAESLFGIAPQSFMVGDCRKPRKIMDATFEGYSAAAHL